MVGYHPEFFGDPSKPRFGLGNDEKIDQNSHQTNKQFQEFPAFFGGGRPIPSGKLTWLAGISRCSIGNTEIPLQIAM